MDRTYIINASPLILFEKVNRLDLITSLGSSILIPAAVVNEISVGLNGGQIVRYLEQSGKFVIVPAVNVNRSIATWDLGEGETQVLAVAMGIPKSEVIIDDLAARKCASAVFPSRVAQPAFAECSLKRRPAERPRA